MEFVWWVPAELQNAALEIEDELNPAEAQVGIDEWAGCMAVELIDISPLEYLQTMVRRYRDGNFGMILAKDIADIRAKSLDDEKSIVEIEICEVGYEDG